MIEKSISGTCIFILFDAIRILVAPPLLFDGAIFFFQNIISFLLLLMSISTYIDKYERCSLE